MKVFLDAAAIYTPGLKDWMSLQGIRAGRVTYAEEVDSKYAPEILPRNERRRASTLTRLAFRLAEAVKSQSGADFSQVASLFASAGGDYEVVHKINTDLAIGDKQISPTDFHNSVHNAAGGYWGIAVGSHFSSSSLSAGDDTFQAGLLEAALHCSAERQAVLYVAADIPPPFPLQEKCPVKIPFGVGLLFQPDRTSESQFELRLSLKTVDTDCGITAEALRGLPAKNPLARSISLLEAMAGNDAATVLLAGDPGVKISFHACI